MSKYIVQRGDTLTQIAGKFNTTVDELVEVNNIADPDKIYTGQVLLVPDKNDSKDYEAIGKQFDKCLSAIEALPEVKELSKLL